jgi:hypothetical protein
MFDSSLAADPTCRRGRPPSSGGASTASTSRSGRWNPKERVRDADDQRRPVEGCAAQLRVPVLLSSATVVLAVIVVVALWRLIG